MNGRSVFTMRLLPATDDSDRTSWDGTSSASARAELAPILDDFANTSTTSWVAVGIFQPMYAPVRLVDVTALTNNLCSTKQVSSRTAKETMHL